MKKLKPIGYVEVSDNPRRFLSKIILNENSAVDLTELSRFNEIVVIRSATEFEKKIYSSKDSDGSDITSLCSVKLISVDENVITVEGLTEIQGTGTPILDIKPYYPEYDLQIGEEKPQWQDFVWNQAFN